MTHPSPDSQNCNRFIGLMSGTSLDGIDGVLCNIYPNGATEILLHISRAYSPELKKTFLALQETQANEIHLEALAANSIAQAYADIVQEILLQSAVNAQEITAIGAHGQTIRHRPRLDESAGYSKQSLNGALLAELTQIDVICDFRSRDIAAHGQGAPLVPAFHVAQFSHPTQPRAVLNLGGIANLTLLRPQQAPLGFDTGPANLLLDAWICKHRQQSYDENGTWARSGTPHIGLLEELCSAPYLSLGIPKSTGREEFNLVWLEAKIQMVDQIISPEDVQATLAEFTAISISSHLNQYLPAADELIVCGGGAKNNYLMARLTHHCKQFQPQLKVFSSAKKGIDPQTVEAMAFAWLAWSFVERRTANIPEVTGAKGSRVLGALYPK